MAHFITSGFEDLLHIGGQQRPDLFALNIEGLRLLRFRIQVLIVWTELLFLALAWFLGAVVSVLWRGERWRTELAKESGHPGGFAPGC